MKAPTLVLGSLACLAQAVSHFSHDGMTYSITMTKHGVEIPASIGSIPGASSHEMQTAVAKARARRQQQQQQRQQARDNLDKRDLYYSSNWCGLANTNPPSGVWKNVWGGWVVPTVSLRSGQTDSQEPSIAQWVGIDGIGGCNGGLIQGGTVSYVDGSGAQQNYAWWEFVPWALVSIDGFPGRSGVSCFLVPRRARAGQGNQ
jgi:hypothetical protein